jgi:hypothetical protein
VSDIDTAAADSLKALDPERPIREADMAGPAGGFVPVENDPLRKWSVRRITDAVPPRASRPPKKRGVLAKTKSRSSNAPNITAVNRSIGLY